MNSKAGTQVTSSGMEERGATEGRRAQDDTGRLESSVASPAEEDRLEALAAMFRALGDPTRLRVLVALARRRLCVCEISERLGLSPPAISHQLRVLRGLHLVRAKREGKHVYYQLDDRCVSQLVNWGLLHAAEVRSDS